MAKYRISDKVIAHNCKNNHVALRGEEVDESQLLSPAEELVKKGYIELVDEKKVTPKKTTKK